MSASKKGGIRLTLAWIALIGALLLPVWFIVAALGTSFGLWGWQTGLIQMTITWGPMLIGAVGLISLIALILGLIKSPRIRPVLLSVGALLVTFLVFGRLAHMGSVAGELPPIHDIQTDWSDPVRFSETVMEMRGPESNPVVDDPVVPELAKARWPDLAGRKVSEVQAEKYEPLQTMIREVSPEVMYTAAYLSMNEMGIELVTEDEENYRLEGTFTSQWFGFKDDVAVRIRARGQGAEMDVRSISRVGLSDLGANVERVHTLLEKVDARLDQLKTE